MDVREKLMEIVKRASYCCLPSNTQDFHINMFVTDLLAHGVTVQKHGRWEKAKYIEAPVYVCSECGNREPLPRKFCPECGAMTEKEG